MQSACLLILTRWVFDSGNLKMSAENENRLELLLPDRQTQSWIITVNMLNILYIYAFCQKILQLTVDVLKQKAFQICTCTFVTFTFEFHFGIWDVII